MIEYLSELKTALGIAENLREQCKDKQVDDEFLTKINDLMAKLSDARLVTMELVEVNSALRRQLDDVIEDVIAEAKQGAGQMH